MAAMFRWFVLMCCLIAGTAYVGFQGLFINMWEHDVSKLSVLTLSLFTILSLFVGYLTYQVHLAQNYLHETYIKACWFGSELLMGFGMMGTLIGFMLMFNSKLASIDVTQTENIKAIIVQLGYGLTTAVTTTLVGLITSLLLKLQLVNLELDLDTTDET